MNLRTSWLVTAGLLAAAVSASPGVPLNPNGQKYRERKPAVTGRAGSATLSARMLIDREQQTLVQMTTGALDAPPAPTGNIVKAQIKAYDGEGNPVFTRNYAPASPSADFVASYRTLRRGQPLQQGNDWEDVYDDARRGQSVEYHAWLDQPLAFPITVRTAVSDATRTSVAVFADRDPREDGSSCDFVEDSMDGDYRRVLLYVSSCSYRTFVSFWRHAGTVTYLSRGLYRSWHRNDAGEQQVDSMSWWFANWAAGDPGQLLAGPDYTVSAEILAGDGVTYRSPVAVHTVRSVAWEDIRPETCADIVDAQSTYRQCSEIDHHDWVDSGTGWWSAPH